MSLMPTMVVAPSAIPDVPGQAGRAGGGFGTVLQRAVEQAIQTGHAADHQAQQAIGGNGSLTDVVTTLAQTELMMQTITTVRDRTIQAYQDVMRMPI